MIRDAATEAQVRASRPDQSTWLSANAGSGKTRVLTDRVARLLLTDVPPDHILCLTYTKAAATEMQNRLFSRLGGWAMLDDAALRNALASLGVETRLDAEFLRHARTLFARAIETPGGLRIQTIHSFCAALLRRFPLEAGISPQFTEMEDRAAELLRADLLDRMALGPDAPLLEAVARHHTDQTLDHLTAGIVRHRRALAGGMDAGAIRARYGLGPDLTPDDLAAEVFLGGEDQLLADLVTALQGGSNNDQKAAAKLQALGPLDLSALPELESVFLNGSGAKDPFAAKIGSFPTGPTRKGAAAPLMPRLEDFMRRVETARERRLALAASERDSALARFAATFLPAFEAEKQRRGWLDFDDLIDKAGALLTDPGVAAWVLYRLDGGIDHILVDEAQDTSPVQWQMIERLAQEITAGEGARQDVRRTIFVVGDKKQSIYSFQGADPSEFDRMRDDFAARLRDTDAPLGDHVLRYSFRSADPVLRLVDMTFQNHDASGFGQDALHQAFKDRMPGRVDLWPMVEKAAKEEDSAWFDPVDRTAQNHHDVTLARRIAGFIAKAVADRHPLPQEIGNTGDYTARPVRPGDVLILVQKRGRLFHEIIRACKQAELPIAGADVLRVSAELAVRDLGALLSFLATPEDDLSLASALKSPLFGLGEQQLYDLAHKRPEGSYLWRALYDRAEDFPGIVAVLEDLRGQTDFLRPYDLIERILTRHDGRRLLLGRLGDEAQDGIDALLVQALGYEQTDIPSLTGFLQWLQTDDVRIKRPADNAGDRIRVMTVHGAKGLEAPVVILPDCAKPDTTLRDEFLVDTDGAVLWKARAEEQPARQRAALVRAKERAAQERDRLLYVGLTRAESWLIVAAAGDTGKDGSAWYDKVARGIEAAGATDATFDFGTEGSGAGRRLSNLDWSTLPMRDTDQAEVVKPALPALFHRPAAAPVTRAETIGPSKLGGLKALPGMAGEDEEAAKARGTWVHLLLEHLPDLPAADRRDTARRLLRAAAPPPEAAQEDNLIDEALGVITAPDLAPIFQGPDGATALSEVQISAPLSGFDRPLSGVIDRLIVTPDRVTAIDYKTNREVPESAETCPDGLLRQMAAYAAMLAQVYPGRDVETGFLWTAQARYMPLPPALLTQSLERARLDAAAATS